LQKINILKKLILLILSLSFITFSSCDTSTPECWEISGTGTISVDGETETTVNEPLQLLVTYVVVNECDNFYLFFEEISEGVKWITVNVRYDGCNCPGKVVNRVQPYNFVASEPGEYVLRFKVTNSEYIEKIITVTE
jgi:hypothetical protein